MPGLKNPMRIVYYSLMLILEAASRVSLRRKGVGINQSVRLAGAPIVELASPSSIDIGARVVLTSASRSTALGVSHPVVLRTLFPGASIVIGPDTGISGASICAAMSVSIGARCLIGADVMIFDTDFHPLEASGRRHAPIPTPTADDGVSIGNDVFIGARSVILKGSRIGDGAVIGAGSVVRGEIPPGAVAAGNPASVIRVPEF